MIKFTPDRYIHALYYASNEECNFLGCLFQVDGQPPEMLYRFRYFVDEKVFDSDDRRSWYHAVGGQRSIRGMHRMLMEHLMPAITLRFGGAEVVELCCRGDDLQALRALESLPWWHGRVETGPDAGCGHLSDD